MSAEGAAAVEHIFKWIERVGNRLPHPFWLFVYICLGTIILSMITAGLGWEAENPKTGEVVQATSLFSKAALQQMVLMMVENFAHFAPLGIVIIMLMGVAVSEKSGLLEAIMKKVVFSVPGWLVIPAIIVLAACGNIGSDAGIVVVPPLAAIIFKRMGKPPLAGIVLGYAAATAGFTANLVPAGTDVLLSAITTEAMQTIEPGGEVVATSNLYFMIASTFMLALLFTWVVKKFTIPLFANDKTEVSPEENVELSDKEKKGLRWALGIGVVYVILVFATIIPENGLLRHADPELFMRSPFFKGLIPILFLFFVILGWVYGKVVGTVKKKLDIVNFMVDGVRALAPYIVLCFMIAQFIKLFQWSHMDQLIAIEGAEFLKAANFHGSLLFIAFVIMAMLINLFIGSASAKWAMMAPVFVPMLYHVNVPPAVTQLVYRIGDSVTNGISPLYVMFPLILGWVSEHKKNAGVGTVFSLLLPYAVFSALAWMVLLVIWYNLGLPVGVGEPIR